MEKLSERIHESVRSIMSRCRPMTNCYAMGVVERATRVWTAGDSFIFSYEDHGVNRLVYFAEDEGKLSELLKLPQEDVCFVEFMTRDPKENGERLGEAGFVPCARMMRLVNPDCRQLNGDALALGDGDRGALADRTAAHEINQCLWSTFRTEISHLLTDEELAAEIGKGHTRIHRDSSGRIDAILQADVMPKKFYINQIVNQGDRRNIHAMLQTELAEYTSNGGKYLYAWVEDDNIGSQKFHGKYGMKHDGMWSMIYTNKR